MIIGIIGSNGFLGKEISKVLSIKNHFNVYNITKENYSNYFDTYFDVLINANGNSIKYWANQNPLEDFDLSTKSVYKSIINFKFTNYIYISSMDVNKDNYYGLNKKLSEEIVKSLVKNYIILRCSVIVGNGMKKGVVKDILDEKEVHITKDSALQFISNIEIAHIIYTIIIKNLKQKVLNVGGIGNIKVEDIGKILNKKIKYTLELENQYFNEDVSELQRYYPKLESSIKYIKELNNERMERSV